MKKNLSFFLMITLFLSLFNIAYANEDISLSIIEPDIKVVSSGEEINYRLNVKLARPARDYKTIFLTYEISPGIEYKEASLMDLKFDDENMSITTTLQQNTGSKRYININLYKPEVLGNSREFNINIRGQVNEEKKPGEKFSSRLVASYQFEDLRSGSEQVESQSNFTYAGDQKEVQALASSRLDMLMGDSYSDFFTYVQGMADKNALVEVDLAGNKVVPEVGEDGSFGFMLPSGIKDNIRITVKDKSGLVLKTMDLRYLNISNITRVDLSNTIEAIRRFGRGNLIERYVADFESQMAMQGVLLGLEGGTKQDIYSFYEKLYLLVKDEDPRLERVHKAFMQGYPEGNFLPENSISRAEVATILSRILIDGEVEEMNSSFPDVGRGKWYTKYIAHMEREGIMKGYDDGKFMPNNKISRAEFASVIARFKNLTAMEMVNFNDMKLNHWAADDIIKVVTAGYMEGYPEGNFGYDRNVTRAEAATTFNRALARTPDKNFIDRNKLNKFNDIGKHWAYYQIIEATVDHNYIMENGKEVYR